MKIKGIEVSSKRPVLCVPIVETTEEGILQEAEKLAADHAGMIEWRVDWFDMIEDTAAVQAVLIKLRPLLEKTILLFTFRSSAQGGNGELPPEQLHHLYHMAAQTGCVDMIDVEFYSGAYTASLVDELQQSGVRVVTSHHDFVRTPEETRMTEILKTMRESGTDFVKLAVMPKKSLDVIALMKVTGEFHEQYPDTPIVTMSMGQLGIVSRLSGELTGSCVTFGAHGQCSAPGQMEMNMLGEILNAIHGDGGTR